MRYRRRLYRYGDVAEVYIYPVKESGKKGKGSRGKKRKPSRACQKELNNKHRAGRLNREISANFNEGDSFFTLTYKTVAQDYDRAHKDIVNFIKRYKRAARKAGFTGEIKYIYVTEQGRKSQRWHHHIILSGELKASEVQKIWGLGLVDIRPLLPDEGGQYKGLAWYMCKLGNETDEAEKADSKSAADIMTGGRIHRSRNIKPVEPTDNDYEISRKKAEKISKEYEKGDDIDEFIPLLQGYEIKSIESFFNEIDGCYYPRIILHKRKVKKGRGKI